MRKISLKSSYLILVICPLLIQGCASKQITRRDLESTQNIRVVRYRTPDLTVKTLTGVAFDLVGGGAILPTLIARHADTKATEEATQEVIFPDYGELLMEQFMRIAPAEIRGWPKMTSIGDPVQKGYKYKDGALLVFYVDHLWITLLGGLTIEGDVTMKSSKGDKILARHFWYRSKDYGVVKDQKEYTADNCKLLRDEIPLAAERTARDLIIRHLKEGL